MTTDVNPVDLRQFYQVGVTGRDTLDQGVGIEDQGTPGTSLGSPVQEQKNLGKQATVEVFIWLKLHLDENPWLVTIFPGGEHAIQAEGRLLDFFRAELIKRSRRRVQTGQIQGHLRPALKKRIEKTVGFQGRTSGVE